jgi:Histidine kinase-like ATPase domain
MELTIPASPAQLASLRQAARQALREVPPQIADELVLALDEAATNAVLHGSRGGDPVQVAVWVRGRLGRGHRGGPRPSPATPPPTDHRPTQQPRPGAVAA